MQITEVRVTPTSGNERVRAYASITFDRCFVVDDVKVIEGPNGLFIAMPSRKILRPCPECGIKNVVQASYCNNCGSALPYYEGREFHSDVAHPINGQCRQMIHDAVIKAYENTLPSARDVQGIDITGGVPSEEYVRSMR